MKMNRIFICLILCISCHVANGQLKDTFEKGTITTNENKRIEGYIKTNDLSHLSSEICFKLEKEDVKYVCYNTTQIKSFQTVTGKTFDLLSIKTKNDSSEIAVFANLILKGKASLYKTTYKSTILYIVVVNNKNYVLQNDELVYNEVRKYNYQGVLNIATEGFLMANYSKIEFKEIDFIKVITQYNTSKGSESKEVTYNEKNIHYSIVNIGGGGAKDEYEFFFQAMYRLYYPKISRSTSLNMGLNYFNHQFQESFGINTSKFKQSLISLPLQFQQNLLNKNIRPYLFAGFNLSYTKIVDDRNNSLIEAGFQKSFGVGFLYGAGIELDLYKGIMLKSEYRYEIFNHLLLFGIGYNFSK